MPGYWFMYNMYALARNAGKYLQRDGRPTKKQHIENHYLAPDSVNEIFDALEIMEYAVGKAFLKKENKFNESERTTIIKTGKKLLIENNPVVDQLEVLLDGVENSGRKVLLIKARAGYHTFREMIEVYCAEGILSAIEHATPKNLNAWLKENIKSVKRKAWVNVGGQLIEKASIDKLIKRITTSKIKTWEQIHHFYLIETEKYPASKLSHAIAAYHEIFSKDLKHKENLIALLDKALHTKTKMLQNMSSSREKDYTSPFRTMAYANRKEMDAVTGKLEENSFILEQTAALKKMKAQIKKVMV
jgi:paraquat-inducible protein B